MDRKKYFEIGLSLVGIGGFLASLPSWVKIPLITSASQTIQNIGTGIGLIGIIFCIVPFLPKIDMDFPKPRQVKRNDLNSAYSFCKKIFSGDFSSFNTSKRWFKKNKDMFWIVEQSIQRGPATVNEVRGFFSIIPLTYLGKEMLLEGDIDGSNFTKEHICATNESPAALYVGAVGAKGLRAKGVALGAITSEISNNLRNHNIEVYTTPRTKDGLRIAKKFGFEAVDGSGTKDLNKLYILEENL